MCSVPFFCQQNWYRQRKERDETPSGGVTIIGRLLDTTGGSTVGELWGLVMKRLYGNQYIRKQVKNGEEPLYTIDFSRQSV
jgi:hypothetical protein